MVSLASILPRRRYGAGECRAFPDHHGNRGESHRATSVEIRLIRGNWQVRMDGVELLVEMGELAPSVFEEKSTANGKCTSKEVQGKHGHEDKNGQAVGVVQGSSVLGHELQLIEEPEAVPQQGDDGEEQCVCDHRWFLASEVFPY